MHNVGFADGHDAGSSSARKTIDAPALAALGNYGGPTQTMPPLGGGPATGGGVVVIGITTDRCGLQQPV